MSPRELIESAFALVPYPGDARIIDHPSCLECAEIAEYFRGTGWRGHTIRKLWEHHMALSLFTPEALHYYLPAFMLGTLDHPREADHIPLFVSTKFIPDFTNSRLSQAQKQRYHEERVSRFTPAQKRAVAAFLREYSASGEPNAEAVLDALPHLET